MSWRARFWFNFPTTKAFVEVKLDPKVGLYQQKIDDRLYDDAGRQWFKPDMEGDPDFVWVKDESTEGHGPVSPFGPLPA